MVSATSRLPCSEHVHFDLLHQIRHRPGRPVFQVWGLESRLRARIRPHFQYLEHQPVGVRVQFLAGLRRQAPEGLTDRADQPGIWTVGARFLVEVAVEPGESPFFSGPVSIPCVSLNAVTLAQTSVGVSRRSMAATVNGTE